MAARRKTDSENWGGPRPGSGPRPKYDPEKLTIVGVQLPQTVVEVLDAMAAQQKPKPVTRSEMVRRLLTKNKAIAAAFKAAEL